MKYVLNRGIGYPAGVFLSALLLSACAHVQGYTTLSDGNVLKVTGYGPDVSMDWKCLKESTVVQLAGSRILDGVPKSDCYMATIIATKSSVLSKAAQSYVARSGALQNQATTVASLASTVATSAGDRAVVAAQAAASPSPQRPADPATASVANSIAATVAAAPDSNAIQAAASSVGPLLSAANMAAVKQRLQDLSVQTPDLSLSSKLNEAANQLGPNP
jgi:hypothetical protein